MFPVSDSSPLEGLFAALAISIVVFLARFAFHRDGKTALQHSTLILTIFSLISSLLEVIKALFGYPPHPSLFVCLFGAAYLCVLSAVFREQKRLSEVRVPVKVREES